MHTRGALLASLFCLLPACGDDPASADTSPLDAVDVSDNGDALAESTDATPPPETTEETIDALETETEVPPEADAIFAFRAHAGQSISEGPFPNDGLIGAGGTIELAPLASDARFAGLAKAPILARTDGEIAAKRGFGFVSSAFFPMNAEPDITSFDGAVHYVALTGPEQGKVFPGVASWYRYANYLAVFPAWGHYLVPGSKYGIVIDLGVKAADGRTIEAPPAFAEVIAAQADAPGAELVGARAAFADLRQWLSLRDQAAVIGTVFSTEPTLPLINALFAAVDAFPLAPPTHAVRWSPDTGWQAAESKAGADLDAYFGVPQAPFLYMPTPWYPDARIDAGHLAGGTPYAGGSFHGSVAYVSNGTFVAPAFNLSIGADDKVSQAAIAFADGVPVARARQAVPFTVYLCTSHLTDGAPDPDKTVPFSIFTHGGTALRSDALPFAVANCASGYATVSFDLPFHGGRQELAYVADEDVVAPARADADNVYSGKKPGEQGFVPDHVGDNGGATVTVGGLFALASDFDPTVIEANLLTISVDAYTLVRVLKDPGPAGMSAFLGTKVDADHLVMESLSFGTSFTSALMAASDDFVGAVQSVGSSGILTLNLPMAPNNAILAGGIIRTIFGLAPTLAEINAGAHHDPMIALLQWLSQRGDSAGYAPFVLRHRQDEHALHVFGSGDSWDETLFSPAQLSFNAAWGLPVFAAGSAWTLDAAIPGADTVAASAFSAPLSANLSFGTRTQSAAYFYNSAACHAQVVTPVCSSGFTPPYPPATPRAEPLLSESPICALHTPVIRFLADLLEDKAPSLVAPSGSCADLYAP